MQVKANTELELQAFITRYNEEKVAHDKIRDSVKVNVSTEKGDILSKKIHLCWHRIKILCFLLHHLAVC